MHDLRRQVLESGKTVSKKARSKAPSVAASSKTNSRTQSRQASDDEEGDMSDSTNWSTNSIDDMLMLDPLEDTNEAWKQELEQRIEEIMDRKKSSLESRETALAAYIHILMSRYAYDEVEPRALDLFPALLKSVKLEESEKEASLALRAIALTLITAPSDDIYDALTRALKSTYMSSDFLSVKAAAIHTLGTAVVYGGAADTETEDVMDTILEIIESDGSSIEAADSAEVVIAALEVWGFLATYVDDTEDKCEAAMDAFVEQLESGDTAVQVAAGENIALLYEKSFTERELEDGPPSEDDLVDDEGYELDTEWVKRYDVYRQKGQLTHKLSQIANESSRVISKKDRKTLHTNFADILNSVEYPTRGPRYQKAISQSTGERLGSRLTIRIHNTASMKIDKWWKLHRLALLRRVLGSGFVVHYEKNEVVFETLPAIIKIDTGRKDEADKKEARRIKHAKERKGGNIQRGLRDDYLE